MAHYANIVAFILGQIMTTPLLARIAKNKMTSGGKRHGAGRPKGTTKPPTIRITIPLRFLLKVRAFIRGLYGEELENINKK